MELPTLACRALIVAGMPRGAAEAAARLILWLELEKAEGLAFLERHCAHLAGAGAEPVRIVGETAATLTLDGGGRSALLTGPMALDLATVKARRTGLGVARVSRSPGGEALGGLAQQAAGRGLAGLIAASAGATLAFPAGEEAAARFESTDPWALLSLFPEAAAPPKDGYLLYCAEPHRVPRPPPDWRAGVRHGAEDIGLRRERAVRDGLEVDEALWRRLRSFGDRVLIPTSERSRRGAGE